MDRPRWIATVTASGGAAWEPELLGRLGGRSDVRIVRRCVDLADVLATAATGTAGAVLVGPALHRLDRDAVARLRSSGVAVVGVAPPGDTGGRDRLLSLGIDVVLPAGAPADEVAATLVDAVEALARRKPADSHRATSAYLDGVAAVLPATCAPIAGRLVAVWGPTGAPGRTTVAVNLAAELAASGVETMLADADTYGASVAQALGLLDEAPGLAAAVRAAAQGALDASSLARHARRVGPRLRVLTGLPRPDRWPELRPAALAHVWDVARGSSAVVVVDCGFSLEQDEEIAFDVAAPRRNAATVETLDRADLVLAIGSADPVGMQRLVRGLGELHAVVPGATVRVVVNRVRRSVTGNETRRAPVRVLRRHAGVDDALLVPDNATATDAALMAGRPLLEVAPRAPARLALRQLADEVAAALLPAQRPTVRARHRARVAETR